MVNLNHISPVAGESQTATTATTVEENPTEVALRASGIDPASPEADEYRMQALRMDEVARLGSVSRRQNVDDYEDEIRSIEERIAMLTPPLGKDTFEAAVARARRTGRHGLKLVNLPKAGKPRDTGTSDYLPTKVQLDALRAAVKRYDTLAASSDGQQAIKDTVQDNLDNITFVRPKWDVTENDQGEAVPVLDTKIDFGKDANLSAVEALFGKLK